jgi:hypothetical protein
VLQSARSFGGISREAKRLATTSHIYVCMVAGSSAKRREVRQYIEQIEADYKRKQSKELL